MIASSHLAVRAVGSTNATDYGQAIISWASTVIETAIVR